MLNVSESLTPPQKQQQQTNKQTDKQTNKQTNKNNNNKQTNNKTRTYFHYCSFYQLLKFHTQLKRT